MMAVFLIVVSILTLGSEIHEVPELNANDITQNCTNRICFFKLFLPNCPHCKHLAPIWKSFAKKYSNNEILIAEIDCSQKSNKGILSNFDGDGYPTLILIDNGKYFAYSGDRSERDLAKFLYDHSRSRPMISPYTESTPNFPNIRRFHFNKYCIIGAIIIFAISFYALNKLCKVKPINEPKME